MSTISSVLGSVGMLFGAIASAKTAVPLRSPKERHEDSHWFLMHQHLRPG
jgi:hypothetical protein